MKYFLLSFEKMKLGYRNLYSNSKSCNSCDRHKMDVYQRIIDMCY